NLYTTMEEMSNTTKVPMSYLSTRGQQIKVLAQMYRLTQPRNIIIPFQKKTDNTEKYQGATVIEANPGDYDLVVTLDFTSLYPSIMIAYNLCYTTAIDPKDILARELYNLLEFSSNVKCEHDPLK